MGRLLLPLGRKLPLALSKLSLLGGQRQGIRGADADADTSDTGVPGLGVAPGDMSPQQLYVFLISSGLVPTNELKVRYVEGQMVAAESTQLGFDARGIPIQVQDIQQTRLGDGTAATLGTEVFRCSCGELMAVTSRRFCGHKSCQDRVGCCNCTVSDDQGTIHCRHRLMEILKRWLSDV